MSVLTDAQARELAEEIGQAIRAGQRSERGGYQSDIERGSTRRTTRAQREPSAVDAIFNTLGAEIGSLPVVNQLLSAGEQLEGFLDDRLLSRMQRVQDQFGGIAGQSGDAFRNGASIANQYTTAILEFNKGLTGNTQEMNESVSGLGVSFRSLVGDASTAIGAFDRMTTGTRGSADGFRFLQTATEETIRDMAIFGQQMNMAEDEIATFMTREISLGREAGSMLQEAAVYSARVAGITGDSAKEIMDSIEGIVADTQRYGNVSVAEAAKIGGALRQLGLDYGELGGMTDKYFDFESAASSVSALTSVFGVQIDAMEAMRLANSPDRLDFLTYMRDQFMASGKAVEDMTLAEKRLVQQQLGLSSIEAVERLFDPTVDLDNLDAIEAATDEGVGTFEESLQELDTQIQQFGQGTTGALERLRDASRDAFVAGMQEDILSTVTQLNEVEGAIDSVAQSVGREAAESDALGLQGRIADMDAAMERFSEMQESVLRGLRRAFLDPEEGIVAALSESLDEAFAVLTRPPWREQSPSIAGKMMTGGIIKAFEELPQSATKEFRKAGAEGDKAFTAALGKMEGFDKIAELGMKASDLSKAELQELADQFEVDAERMGKALDLTAKNTAERDTAQKIEASIKAIKESGLGEENIDKRLESLARHHKLSAAAIREAALDKDGSMDLVFEAIMNKKKKAVEAAEEKEKDEKDGKGGTKVEPSKAKSDTNESTKQLEEAKAAQRKAEAAEAEARKKLAEAQTGGPIVIKIEPSDVILKVNEKAIATAAIDGFKAGATDSGGRNLKVELTT